MTNFKDFLSSNSEDPIMESYSEKIISTKIEKDRRKKWEKILTDDYAVRRENKVNTKTRSIRNWVAIAASFLLLGGAFFFITNSDTKGIPELAQLEINELNIHGGSICNEKR